MSDRPAARVEEPGPADFASPTTSREFHRAIVWAGVAIAVVLLWFLAQPLLLIFGGFVFAQMLDGGVRLLGRVTRLGRGLRLAIVAIGVLLMLMGFFYLAGSQLVGQAAALQQVVSAQVTRLLDYAHSTGVLPQDQGLREIGAQLVSSMGRVTAWVGSALGAISSLFAIVVIGLFVAVEPRLYERGFAWMLPMAQRDQFYVTAKEMGHTMRRLMFGRLIGMAVEGVFTWLMLSMFGVPMALALGLVTGLLAFLPNIGAIVSGVLTVLVGFSAGFDTGIGAIITYVLVQGIDGYLIVPMVAKRSVDLAPALVLGAQLLFGALFGVLGLALADPIVAMVKVLLEKKSELAAEHAEGEGAPA
jgi:predicted PurR-regulated permease PerM